MAASGALSAVVTPSVSQVNEGGQVTFNIVSQGVPNGTSLYYNITGAASSADFSDGLLQGSFTITSNAGSFTKTLLADSATEGSEVFTVEIRSGSVSGPIMQTCQVTINDTQQAPTYQVSPSVSSVNEGGSVTFTVTTTSVPNSTTLYWTISGTATSADFSDSAVSGSFTITSNTGSIVRTLTQDALTEGAEQFTLSIRTGSTSGTVVATSSPVTINDTQQTPTYQVSPNVSSVNEGGSVTFTVTTTNVPNSTTLYWTISGTATAADFSDSSASGSFTITSNTGSIVRTLTQDVLTEGSEQFTLSVRTGSTSGTVVATSSSVTINDTSVAPTYQISPSATTINEGGSVTFTVNTTNVSNGTTLYWTTSGVQTQDFQDSSISGSFSITSNSGQFQRTMTNDATTEGTEYFTASVRTGSTQGTIVATSSTITVNDTQQTPAPTYSVQPNTTSPSEGQSVSFTVSTTNVPNGTTLYYTLHAFSGNFNSQDVQSGIMSGSFTINSNTGSFSQTLLNDSTTEGTESFYATIRTGSTGGTAVANQTAVYISDTQQSPPATFQFMSLSEVNEGQYKARLAVYSNNLAQQISVSATAYYAVGQNQQQASCTNPYPALNISGSGQQSPLELRSAGWTNHTTAFTLVYYVTISGAYSYSGYSNTANVWL